MLREDELKADKYTLTGGGTAYVLTHLPTRVSVRHDDTQRPVTECLARLRKRLEVCVDALAASDVQA